MISTDVQFIKADKENQEKLLLNIDMLFYTISVMPDNGIQPFKVKSGYRRANNFVANFKCVLPWILAWTVFSYPLAFRILVPQPNLCRNTRIRNVREKNHKVRCSLFTLYNSVFRSFVICQNDAAQVICVVKKLLSSNAINKMIRWLEHFFLICEDSKKISYACKQPHAHGCTSTFWRFDAVLLCFILIFFVFSLYLHKEQFRVQNRKKKPAQQAERPKRRPRHNKKTSAINP